MHIAVVACSLNPDSRSAGLAEHLRHTLEADDAQTDVDWIDLREHDLPLCDGGTAYGHPTVRQLHQRLDRAHAILLALPIYNYDGNAAAKNLIELTGNAWNQKVVGFACSAGGRGSFMSVMPLANSLMLDFRCHIVPRFVYADDSDFTDDHDPGLPPPIARRLDQLAHDTRRLATALNHAPHSTPRP